MSVAKRNDGRFVVKFKDKEGRWKQRSFRIEAEARQFDADCQYDATQNTRMTLLEVVLAFLRNVPHAPHTVSLYEYIIYGHDRKNGQHRTGPAEILADRFVDTLTRRDLETVRENCRNDGLAIVTINAYVSALKAAMNWCVDQELIRDNPWAKYRRLPGGKYRHRSGTLEDFIKLYPFLPEWLQWASKTAIALCLRPGISELFSLEWSSFNWRAKEVVVFMPKVDATKTVYPPEEYLQEAWPRYQSDRANGKTLVCRSRSDGKVSSSMYDSAWRRAGKKAGTCMPMYALRHMVTSEMFARGADVASVSGQLGHRNPKTTLEFYTKALTASQRRAALTIPYCTDMVQIGAENEDQIECFYPVR